jgi:prevent-host-death family protein
MVMTMVKQDPRTVPAGEFKAKCLALLDEVAASGRELVVTKRGRPVARVTPIRDERRRSLRGSIVFEKDIVKPTGERWDADE